MKKIKNKGIGLGIILFIIIGIYNIPKVSADEVEIPPVSYLSYRTNTLEAKDDPILYISSDGLINVYIMNAEQFSKLQNSGGLTWEYHKRWKDITYLEYTFTIPEDGIYYVVLYNKNTFYKRTGEVQISIDYYYEPYEPDDSYDGNGINYFWNLLLFVVIPIVAIILVIIIPIILIRRHKKKIPKEVITIENQSSQTPNDFRYCNQCGQKIGKEVQYCSFCGAKQ